MSIEKEPMGGQVGGLGCTKCRAFYHDDRNNKPGLSTRK
jgi:hypothetical protein